MTFRDDEAEQGNQRSVAELLAQYGAGSPTAGGRRRRRATDPEDTAPQSIIERVLSDSGTMRAITDATPPPSTHARGDRADLPARTEQPPPAPADPGPPSRPGRPGRTGQHPVAGQPANAALGTGQRPATRPRMAPPDEPVARRSGSVPTKRPDPVPTRRSDSVPTRLAEPPAPTGRTESVPTRRAGPPRRTELSAPQPAVPVPPPAARLGRRPRADDEPTDSIPRVDEPIQRIDPEPLNPPPPPRSDSGAFPVGGGVTGTGGLAAASAAQPAPAAPTRAERATRFARPLTSRLGGLRRGNRPAEADTDDPDRTAIRPGAGAGPAGPAGAVVPSAAPPEIDDLVDTTETITIGQIAEVGQDRPAPIDEYGDQYADQYDEDYGHPAQPPEPGPPPRRRVVRRRDDELPDDELDSYDQDGDAGEPEPTSVKEWLTVAAQLVAGATAGAALWLAFRYLWKNGVPLIAAVAGMLVTVIAVLLVRRIWRSNDLRTIVMTVLIGLFVTMSPAVLLLDL